MRRSLFVLCLVLFAAVPLAAQTYPPELFGVNVEGAADLDVFVYEVEYCPWSMPDPGYDQGYLGYGHSNPDGSITVTLDCWADFPGEECLFPAPPPYLNGLTLPWVPEAVAYMVTELRPDGLVAFEALSFIPRSPALAFWRTGCFDIQPGHPLPEFVFSDLCILTTYVVNPGLPKGPQLPAVEAEVAYE